MARSLNELRDDAPRWIVRAGASLWKRFEPLGLPARFCIAEDVPVLRAAYAAIKIIMPRVRKSFCCGRIDAFTRPRIQEG